MITFYRILGSSLAEKEAKEEEERRKAMSAKLSGLSKKERIKLLLQKNNMNIDEQATENTIENKKADSNISVSSVEKIDSAADDKISVNDSKVSSLVIAYDSDASDNGDGEEAAHEAKKEVAQSGSVGQDKLYEMVVSVDMKKELTSDALAEMEALFEEASNLPGFDKAKEEIADKREIGNDHEKPDREIVDVKEGTSKALKDGLTCSQPTTSKVVEHKQADIDKGKEIMENVAEYSDDSLVETSRYEQEEYAEESKKDDKERPNVEITREDMLQGEVETDEKVNSEESVVSVSAKVTDKKSSTGQSTGESSIEIKTSKKVIREDVEDIVADKEGTRDDVKIKDLKLEDKKSPKEAVDLETQERKEFSVDMFAEESDHEGEELKKVGSELEASNKKDVPRSASKEDKSDKERKAHKEKVDRDTIEVKDQSSKTGEKTKGKVSSKESSKDSSKDGSKEKSAKNKVSKDSSSKVKEKGTDEGKKSKHKEKKKDKEKSKDKKKDKKHKSEHKSEDKKHKDSDKKHKDGEKRRKEDKDDKSSRKKHSEKDRSSEKNARKSKEEAKMRKKEEELLTEKEKLRREEERRKAIQEEIKREEKLRSEYERSKKEERERREEEQRKKEIEEKKLEEKKKEEELKKEEEIDDFAAMLLEGKYEDFM